MRQFSSKKPRQMVHTYQNPEAEHYYQDHQDLLNNQQSIETKPFFKRPTSSKQLGPIEKRNIPQIVNNKQEILTNKDLKFSSFVWPKGIIPYIIDKSFTEKMRQHLKQAIQEFQEKTSIRFVEKKDFKQHNQYVKYTKSPDHRSFVWWIGRSEKYNEHVVYINEDNSSYGTYLHETMHVLGFEHEQCRKDRDTYLSVSVKQSERDYLRTMHQYEIKNDGYMIGEYNFESIMHYPENKNMTLKDEYKSIKIGQRTHLSDGDIKGIEMIYGNSQCTFDAHRDKYFEQVYFECITCWGKGSVFGACRVCGLICHKGHEIIQKKSNSFYCDCGKNNHSIQLCRGQTANQRRVQQKMYLCFDCFDIQQYQQTRGGAPGVCQACAQNCHKQHNLQFYGMADFVCSCDVIVCETSCWAN